jgi:flavin reductase (DIM6/NTAB) family NADH-FMN oxidoreductase RutF
MSRSLGPALPPDLQKRLSQQDLPRLLGRALPLLTVDDRGRPHPMLCSYLELLAVSATVIRVAIGARSSARRNLETRGVATLLVVEPDATMYVKCRAAGTPLMAGELARFDLVVEDVLEDAAAEGEEGARITGGLIYAPVPALDSNWARATLAALRLERS